MNVFADWIAKLHSTFIEQARWKLLVKVSATRSSSPCSHW